jgi:hypothetical protein
LIGRIHRQHGDLINLILFFKIREVWGKTKEKNEIHVGFEVLTAVTFGL